MSFIKKKKDKKLLGEGDIVYKIFLETKKSNESYSKCTLSFFAVNVLVDMIRDIIKRIFKEVLIIMEFNNNNKKTISTRVISTSIKLVLNNGGKGYSELSNNSNLLGEKSLDDYLNYKKKSKLSTDIHSPNNNFLILKPSYIKKLFLLFNSIYRVSKDVYPYLSGSIYFIIKELLEISLNLTINSKGSNNRVKPRELFLAISNDIEFKNLLLKHRSNIIIKSGVFPSNNISGDGIQKGGKVFLSSNGNSSTTPAPTPPSFSIKKKIEINGSSFLPRFSSNLPPKQQSAPNKRLKN